MEEEGEGALPPPGTAPAPKQPAGLLTETHTPLAWEGQLQTSSSCYLNHEFGLPWVMVSVRTKPRPHPQNLLFSPPASGTQVWEQPLPQFSTAPSPFPFGEGSAGTFQVQSWYWAV